MLSRSINRFLSLFGVKLSRTKTGLADLSSEALDIKNLVESQIEESTKRMLQHQIHLKWSLLDAQQSQQNPQNPLDCPLCGYQGAQAEFKEHLSSCIFEGGSLLRHQCPKCDLIFGPLKMSRMTTEELTREYEWHYKVFSEVDSTVHEVRTFQSLQPQKNGVYLNWGAGGWSKTIEQLRKEGWNVYGYEPHASAAEGKPFIITNFEDLKSQKFDGIFSNNVLEHLQYPVETMKQMSSILKDDGKMAHSTPCFEYLYEYTRFHLFFYLGRSRPLLAEKSQLLIESYEQDEHYMNLILRKRP